MKKLKTITVISLVMLLIMGISYALLSDTITVTGSATTTGSLDVNVISASVSNQVGSSNSTISNNNDTITINVPKLEYPGAYTEFSITLKNEGTINAKLKSIVENDMGDANILVSYSGIAVNELLNVNNSKTFTIKVEWLSSSTSASVDGVDISIDFIYEQNV